jgi:uncharacterized protein YjcR
MINAEYLIEQLLSYYKVTTISDLANKIGVSQQSISGWKSRNSISAIKTKCRKLGIYNEIFGESSVNSQNINNFSGMNANVINGNMNSSSTSNTTVPELIIDELEILFKLAIQKDKKDLLFDKLDNFIYQTKRELR